jgi:hypothetical protein
VFKARYGLMPYIKQITFRRLNVNYEADAECLHCAGLFSEDHCCEECVLCVYNRCNK